MPSTGQKTEKQCRQHVRKQIDSTISPFSDVLAAPHRNINIETCKYRNSDVLTAPHRTDSLGRLSRHIYIYIYIYIYFSIAALSCPLPQELISLPPVGQGISLVLLVMDAHVFRVEQSSFRACIWHGPMPAIFHNIAGSRCYLGIQAWDRFVRILASFRACIWHGPMPAIFHNIAGSTYYLGIQSWDRFVLILASL